MATITTDEQFVLACSWLVDNGQLPVQGERFIDRVARKVFDEHPNPEPPPEYPNQVLLVDITPDTMTLEAALDSANTQLTVTSSESAQAASAKSTLQTLMAGLHGLSANDKGYAIYGRIFAFRNGANQTIIDGITNKATAQAYITGLAEWQALPAAAKNFLAKELEANAGLCTALLLVLTG